MGFQKWVCRKLWPKSNFLVYLHFPKKRELKKIIWPFSTKNRLHVSENRCKTKSRFMQDTTSINMYAKNTLSFECLWIMLLRQIAIKILCQLLFLMMGFVIKSLMGFCPFSMMIIPSLTLGENSSLFSNYSLVPDIKCLP